MLATYPGRPLDTDASSTPEPPALDIVGMSVAFAQGGTRFLAVENVSLRVERGRTLALVGESGCGKSVTSLAVMGLLPRPSASVATGEILFRRRDGSVRDVATLDAGTMRHLRGDEMAMIFQEPMTSLNPLQTVGDQVVEALRLHRSVSRRQAREQVAAMFARVGIPEPRERLGIYPHEMSGGMRQRVMIAMALICSPTLLIADEPTTALDVTIQAQILEEMRELQQSLGMAMLFITHDLGVVAEIADRVAVMYAGEIVEEASVEDLLIAPLHPYTRGLMASLPRADEDGAQRLNAIPGIVPDPRSRPAACRFHPRCGFAEPGRCDAVHPPLETVGNRTVRCLRWRELPEASHA
ncbi:MAG: ABC transporter ATP-binding protein [Xanthobacteraceae bacterium]